VRYGSVVLILLAFCSGIEPAVAQVSCDVLPQTGHIEIPLPLHPWMVAMLKRSCALLVSVSDDGEPAKGAIVVLQPVGGSLAVAFMLNLPTEPVGMALTSDESVVAVAGMSRIYFVDVGAMLGGKAKAILGELEYDKGAGTVSVALSRDNHILFASDEFVGTVTLIDFAAAQAAGFLNVPVLGRIPVGGSPTILEVTVDSEYVFVPVEAVSRRYKPPILCADHPGGKAVNAVGAILAIDVAAAQTSRGNAMRRRSYAGCSPVRMKLSQNGRTAFVTDREENLLRILDTTKILRGEPDALVTAVHVGPVPIGLALVDHDRLALVANSNRWAKEQKPQTLTVIDISDGDGRNPAILGSIRVGIFPRDLSVSPDGRTVVVSNFGSNSLTLLDVSKLRALTSQVQSP
jgi:DNA-binding beta-propeller fold protein YncE